ncbi:hypothetical protein B0H16DRAFT_1530552 [Mycena metata]|uniref:HD domain-containing protein n=1 Tax=Mycena metata TaxID=1033252 RepID=A0AAD7JCW6_9AGAR|nr:hypothetical protein B0H16DRAFT_1530552 [Mycena metata]
MTFPKTFDAYVPSNGTDFLALSTFQAEYVPFTTLQAVTISPASGSFAYAKKLASPGVFAHVLRCFYFALALLHTGFPSGTPGVAQIGFEELSLRLYHTSLLHDLAFSNNTEVLAHPAHAMTFELQGAIMTYEHLHAAAPSLDPHQVGDIVQSIVLHTSAWASGNSSANQILLAISAAFDAGGFNGTGIIDYTRLWNPKTVAEIEKAYPYSDAHAEVGGLITGEVTQKPNCLFSHIPVHEARRAFEQFAYRTNCAHLTIGLSSTLTCTTWIRWFCVRRALSSIFAWMSNKISSSGSRHPTRFS